MLGLDSVTSGSRDLTYAWYFWTDVPSAYARVKWSTGMSVELSDTDHRQGSAELGCYAILRQNRGDCRDNLLLSCHKGVTLQVPAHASTCDRPFERAANVVMVAISLG
jgi:hypothetical protein